MCAEYKGVSGIRYSVDKKMAAGGEGTVYRASNGKIVKIYHNKILADRREQLDKKITYMYQHQPMKKMLNYLAWPVDVIRDEHNKFIGFVMNPLDNYKEFGEYYMFRRDVPNQQDFLASIALNLSMLTHAIHKAGYIIGDFNPANIGCRPLGENNPGTVCLYDNDSFQFTTEDGTVFKCDVQCPNYVAPEIFYEVDDLKRQALRQGKDPTITMSDLNIGWTENTDNFALAVHIFQLLFNGYHPYDSKKASDTPTSSAFSYGKTASMTVSPPINDMVKGCCYMFGKGYRPFGKHVPDYKQFPSYLTDLFDRAFSKSNFGKTRPTAREWVTALQRYANEVKRCNSIKEHIYWKGASECPYCKAIGNAIRKISVKFDTGGIGTSIANLSVQENTYITLPVPGYSSNYDFKCWKSSDDTEYNVGDKVKVSKTSTFTAVWIPAIMRMRITFKFFYAARIHRKKTMNINIEHYPTGYTSSSSYITNPVKDCENVYVEMDCSKRCTKSTITVGIEGSKKSGSITVNNSSNITISVWINRRGGIELSQS